jgi:hypothetical protein
MMRFTQLTLVNGVAGLMVGELRAIARSRALTPDEAHQVDAVAILADALRASARQDPPPEFGDAVPALRKLFDAADAATREGGIAVPSEANPHPFPITPTHLAWFGCSSISSCLRLIVTTPAAGRSWRRLAQLEALNEVQAALAELAEAGPGGPAAARVQAAFAAAEQIIEDELPAIVDKAAAIAIETPAGAA